MPFNKYPESKTPHYTFSKGKDEQIRELKNNPLLQRMNAAREEKSGDRYRPIYHYVNPEERLNDPNGLCKWNGKWHLFYQSKLPEGDNRLHWGHCMSDDLIHWEDLPYAIYPSPENHCYSGACLVEDDRVIAIYHGVGLGNMIATSDDHYLLNWNKIKDGAVIPFKEENEPQPYGIFDPCIWKKGDFYYALAAGIIPYQPCGRHKACEYLFRSKDLLNWEYLHPFVEDDCFTVLGDDGACPYFLPFGKDKYALIHFSHMRGGMYFVGTYDKERDKFKAEQQGRFNFGAAFPGGVHAPTAFNDGEDIIVLFNMNPGMPTAKYDNYLAGYYGEVDGGSPNYRPEPDQIYTTDWDQIMTLPRRMHLNEDGSVSICPAGDYQSLRENERSYENVRLERNNEFVFEDIHSDACEIELTMDPNMSNCFDFNVLRSPDKQEYTKISFFYKRGNKYRVPFEDCPYTRGGLVMSTGLSTCVSNDSIISIDNSHSSILERALCRPPEEAPVQIGDDELLHVHIFIDRSVVEVYVNDRQCVALRVYPGREDSNGFSIESVGTDANVISMKCWDMKNIYK